MSNLKSLLCLLALLAALPTCGLAAAGAEPEKAFEIKQLEQLKFADCPAAVQKTLKREVLGATINRLYAGTHGRTTIYEAEVTYDGGTNYDIIVAEDGTLIEKVLDLGQGDYHSTEVPIPALPTAVRRTITREALGGRIEAATTAYNVVIKIEGKHYRVKVAEDGTLISKVLQDDDDDEDTATTAAITKDKTASHEGRPATEKKSLVILTAGNLPLSEPGRKVGLKIEGKNFAIKATKTGILISLAPDEDDGAAILLNWGVSPQTENYQSHR